MSYVPEIDDEEVELVANAIGYALNSSGERNLYVSNVKMEEYRRAAARAIFQLEEYRQQKILEGTWYAEV